MFWRIREKQKPRYLSPEILRKELVRLLHKETNEPVMQLYESTFVLIEPNLYPGTLALVVKSGNERVMMGIEAADLEKSIDWISDKILRKVVRSLAQDMIIQHTGG